MNPVFRLHLPHVFWFLFGCSVLWKVGRLKSDPVNDSIRVIIDGPGEIARIVRGDVWAAINREEGIEVSPPGNGRVVYLRKGGRNRDSGRRWRKVCGCSYAGLEYAGKLAEEEGSVV